MSDCSHCGHTRASHTNGGRCHAISTLTVIAAFGQMSGRCDCRVFVGHQEIRQHYHGGMVHEHFVEVDADGNQEQHDHAPR